MLKNKIKEYLKNDFKEPYAEKIARGITEIAEEYYADLSEQSVFPFLLQGKHFKNKIILTDCEFADMDLKIERLSIENEEWEKENEELELANNHHVELIGKLEAENEMLKLIIGKMESENKLGSYTTSNIEGNECTLEYVNVECPDCIEKDKLIKELENENARLIELFDEKQNMVQKLSKERYEFRHKYRLTQTQNKGLEHEIEGLKNIVKSSWTPEKVKSFNKWNGRSNICK